MLLTCKQFEVDGAPDTIRKMLPLIFSKDQGGWAVAGVAGRGLATPVPVWNIHAACQWTPGAWHAFRPSTASEQP